jgi:hypothetical protein
MNRDDYESRCQGTEKVTDRKFVKNLHRPLSCVWQPVA